MLSSVQAGLRRGRKCQSSADEALPGEQLTKTASVGQKLTLAYSEWVSLIVDTITSSIDASSRTPSRVLTTLTSGNALRASE